MAPREYLIQGGPGTVDDDGKVWFGGRYTLTERRRCERHEAQAVAFEQARNLAIARDPERDGMERERVGISVVFAGDLSERFDEVQFRERLPWTREPL